MAKIVSTTDVVKDTRIYGDDVCELVMEFGKRFHVNVYGFRWYHHTGPECVGIITKICSLFLSRGGSAKHMSFFDVCNGYPVGCR